MEGEEPVGERGDVALCDGGGGEADKAGVKGSTEGEVVGGICLIENVVGSGGRCDGVGRRIGKLQALDEEAVEADVKWGVVG